MLTRVLRVGMASLALIVVVSLPAYSGEPYSRYSVSLWTDADCPADSDVYGFRLNLLYGENREVMDSTWDCSIFRRRI